MVVHLFLNNNKDLDFLPINSIKNGGVTEVLEVKRAGHFMRENGYAEFELLLNTLKPLLQQQAVAQG